MLPIPYNQYLVHEQILGLTGNIRACECIQLSPDTLSLNLVGIFLWISTGGRLGHINTLSLI